MITYAGHHIKKRAPAGALDELRFIRFTVYGQVDGVVTSNVCAGAFPAPTTMVAVVLGGVGFGMGPTVPVPPRVTVTVFPVAAAVSAVAGLTEVVTAVESVGAAVAVVVTDATTCACCPHARVIALVLRVSVVLTGPSTVPGFTLRSAVIVRPVASVIVNIGEYPTSPHG